MYKTSINLCPPAAAAVLLAACTTSATYSRFATTGQWQECIDDALTAAERQCVRDGYESFECIGPGVVEAIGIPACGYAPPPKKLTPELIEVLASGCTPDPVVRPVPPPAGDLSDLFTYLQGERNRRFFYRYDPRSSVMIDAMVVCSKFYFDDEF